MIKPEHIIDAVKEINPNLDLIFLEPKNIFDNCYLRFGFEDYIFKMSVEDFQFLALINYPHTDEYIVKYLVEEGAFESLIHLQELYLNNNALKTIKQGMFKGLHSLQRLTLFGNQLGYFPRFWYSKQIINETKRPTLKIFW